MEFCRMILKRYVDHFVSVTLTQSAKSVIGLIRLYVIIITHCRTGYGKSYCSRKKRFLDPPSSGSYYWRGWVILKINSQTRWKLCKIIFLFFLLLRCNTGDGALLPSPTREKLEPVIPRRREETKEHREEIQPKTKSSPKNSPRTGRSQSLGPTVTERRSPKRQPPRAPSVTKDAKVLINLENISCTRYINKDLFDRNVKYWIARNNLKVWILDIKLSIEFPLFRKRRRNRRTRRKKGRKAVSLKGIHDRVSKMNEHRYILRHLSLYRYIYSRSI